MLGHWPCIDVKTNDIRNKRHVLKQQVNSGDGHCLSDVIEEKILCELWQSERYAIMFNETTNNANVEQLVIHCRYISEEKKSKIPAMIDLLRSLKPHYSD